jgi:synaptobrevin family protein YKT6
VQLCAAHELSDFSRFTRNEYGNFMTMISKTVAERTNPGQRQSVEEQGTLRATRRDSA